MFKDGNQTCATLPCNPRVSGTKRKTSLAYYLMRYPTAQFVMHRWSSSLLGKKSDCLLPGIVISWRPLHQVQSYRKIKGKQNPCTGKNASQEQKKNVGRPKKSPASQAKIRDEKGKG